VSSPPLWACRYTENNTRVSVVFLMSRGAYAEGRPGNGFKPRQLPSGFGQAVESAIKIAWACSYLPGQGHAIVSVSENRIEGSPSRFSGTSFRYLQNTSVTCSRVACVGAQ
jgi:hypothetical protein